MPANPVVVTNTATVSRSAAHHVMKDLDVFKLGDFGTMREKGRHHLHYFVSGFGFTPEYAAPEALRLGTGRAGFQSDMWSFGILLVELLLGHLPSTAIAMAKFHAASQTPAAYADYLAQHPPTCMSFKELRHAGVEISVLLEEVIRSCLQVSLEQRVPHSMALLRLPWFSAPGVAGQVNEYLATLQLRRG